MLADGLRVGGCWEESGATSFSAWRPSVARGTFCHHEEDGGGADWSGEGVGDQA